MLNRVVMMNTKKKTDINKAIEWFDSKKVTVIHAARYSNRGVREEIYLLGAGGNYGVNRGDSIEYITDTGNGHGGRGILKIYDIITSGTDYNNKIMSTQNIMKINEKVKLPIWVIK